MRNFVLMVNLAVPWDSRLAEGYKYHLELSLAYRCFAQPQWGMEEMGGDTKVHARVISLPKVGEEGWIDYGSWVFLDSGFLHAGDAAWG